MPKRKKGSGTEVLLLAPWWISASLGVLAWISLSLVIPSVFASNPLLVGIAALSKTVAWLPLLFFSLIAIVSYFKNRRDTPSSIAAQRKPSLKSTASPQWAPDFKPEKDLYRDTSSSTTAVVFTSIPNWNIESLRSLEWKRFELLCAKYYESVGFKSATLAAGADGGIDIKLYKIDLDEPIAIIQCKAWSAQVSVKEIRELLVSASSEPSGRLALKKPQ